MISFHLNHRCILGCTALLITMPSLRTEKKKHRKSDMEHDVAIKDFDLTNDITIKDAIKQLPLNYRKAIIMFYF